jgi:hypothetical protein
MRILVLESQKSELRLQTYGKKKLQGTFCNYWKVARVYQELFSKIQGSSWKFVDHRLILNRNMGFFAKWHGIIGFELFSNGKGRGLGPRFVDHVRRQSTVDQGQGLDSGSLELGLAAALGHGSLPRGRQCEEGDAA